MNAVERLEAAITKLETLKANVELGDLTVTRFADGRNEDVWIASDYTHPEGDEFGGRTLRTAVVFDRSQGPLRFATAEYIVTLHRTIDAQLAILRFGVQRLHAVYVLTGKHAEAHAHELALADAILGGA